MCIVFIDWSSTGKQWFRATSYVEPCLCWEEVSVKRNRSKTNLLVLENKSFRKFFLHLEEVLHVGSSSCDRLSALWTQQRIQTQPEFWTILTHANHNQFEEKKLQNWTIDALVILVLTCACLLTCAGCTVYLTV